MASGFWCKGSIVFSVFGKILVIAAIVGSLRSRTASIRQPSNLIRLFSSQKPMSRTKKAKDVLSIPETVGARIFPASEIEVTSTPVRRRSKRIENIKTSLEIQEIEETTTHIVTPEKDVEVKSLTVKKKVTQQSTPVIARTIEAIENFNSSGSILLTLDLLHRCKIVARPSKTIKSPYVADIELSNGTTTTNNGVSIMAHAPGLDCCGIVTPGSYVFCSKNADRKSSKTSYAIQLCVEAREDNSLTTIGYYPQLAETISRELIAGHHLTHVVGDYTSYRSQETIGDSRVDFVLDHTDGTRRALEVKNVVGTEYDRDLLPADRVRKGMYFRQKDIDYDIISTYSSPTGPFQRAALFPVGAKKPKIGVVSNRAIKHINNMIQLVDGQLVPGRQEDGSIPTIWRATILFIINRGDCDCFRPCHEADRLFTQMIRRAVEHGVQVIAQEISWNPQSGQAQLGRLLPVILPKSVRSEDIDEDHLKRVLEFVPPPDSRRSQDTIINN